MRVLTSQPVLLGRVWTDRSASGQGVIVTLPLPPAEVSKRQGVLGLTKLILHSLSRAPRDAPALK